MLLGHIVSRVKELYQPRKHIIHIIHEWENLDDEQSRVVLDVAESWNSEVVEIRNATQLLEFVSREDRPPYWLVIDEAQATYGDVALWTALTKATCKSIRNFWVVAAGSYGSHTVVSNKSIALSSSPPHGVLPPQYRMNLFDGNLPSLAFTKLHFDQYLDQVNDSRLKLGNVMIRIMNYASQCDPTVQADDTSVKLMHPGVVDELARHLSKKVCCLVA